MAACQPAVGWVVALNGVPSNVASTKSSVLWTGGSFEDVDRSGDDERHR